MSLRTVTFSAACAVLLAAAAPADQSAGTGPLDEELHELVQTVRDSSRKLWLANIEAPPLATDSGLSERIEQMRRLHLDAELALIRRESGEDTSGGTDEPTTRAVERKPDRLRAQPVSPEVLAKLQASAPSDPAKATRLADTLFSDGHYEPAYALYEAALKGETSERRAAWLVFQMANCKKDSAPKVARQLYLQLIQQYPNSRWVIAARSQEKIIQWRQVNAPASVLEHAQQSVRKDTE